MKKLFLFIWMLMPHFLFSQAKGGVPNTNHQSPITGTTRAVVVGISDYQSPKITDLQFAHRDAEEFVVWLRSPAGGNVPLDNIRLLTNEQATFARIGGEFDWLVEESKEGDEAIIYFSGHGDMETKTFSNFGFLLAFDSPPTNYKIGAYSIVYLQDVISTLSNLKKARVTVVMDACHSGKLAGSSIGGPQATAQALATQFAKELKIMSCQPDELSIEGAKWEGGRGVFSYYLLKGLKGLADKNEDGIVSLFEIGRYLEDKVQAETEQMQLPMTAGDHSATVARVNPQVLEKLKELEEMEASPLLSLQPKGPKEVTLTSADSALYRQFLIALENHDLLTPAGRCANDIYQQLIQREDLKPLHNMLRRNFAIALQDEVQQALNALLESDPYEVHNWRTNPDKYALYPEYLQRAMELLGENHYMRSALLSKKRYFEAHLIKKKLLEAEAFAARRDSFREEAKKLLVEAFRLDENAAYVCHAIADLYYLNVPYRTDSVLLWSFRALERSPRWLLPYLDLSFEYQTAQSDFPAAEKWLLKAVEIDSGSIMVLERLSWLRQRQNRTEETIEICNRIIELKPDLPNGYFTLLNTYAFRREFEKIKNILPKCRELGIIDLGLVLYYSRNRTNTYFIEEAERLFRQDSLPQWAKFNNAMGLSMAFAELGHWQKAMDYILWSERNILYPWYFIEVKIAEGKISYYQGDLQAAEKLFLQSMKADPAVPKYALSLAWLGRVETDKGNFQKADSLFREAIHFWFGSAWDDFLQQEESHYLYGRFLIDQNRLGEAKKMFEKSNELSFQNGHLGWYGLACLAAKQGDKTAALNFLEKSLDCWYPRKEPILQEPLFKKIRKTKRFKLLLAKHFPSVK